MAHIIKKGSGGEPNPLDNQLLTSDGLKNKLAQLGAEHLFFELEVLEVVDTFRLINADTDETTTSQPGAILGRYVFSEQGDRASELQEFLPLDTNILQYPLVGEVVIGFEFNNNRYYFGKVNDVLSKVNFSKFNISGVDKASTLEDDESPTLNAGIDKEDLMQGEYFFDVEPERLLADEGDTIIQGRFGNSIRLGSNQRLGSIDSSNVKIVAGVISGKETLTEDKASIYLTNDEQVTYSEPTKTLAPKMGGFFGRDLDIDYTGPQIVFDSDRVMINAKSNDIGIFAQGEVFIKGNSVNIENSEAVSIVTKSLVADTSAGVKKDITKKLNDVDGDTKLLPENILPMAESMKPHIAAINNGVISAASKILPPVIAPGTPNPLNLFGHLQDLRFFENQLKEVKKFFKFEWLNKQEWKTVSLNDVTEALGLNELDSLPENNIVKWEEFFDDIDAAKAKVANIQAQAAAAAVSVAALNAAFDAIQGGGSSVELIVEALDAYEADPNNPPLDTTDIRDIISDGADAEDVKRYLDFGGSPQVRELLISSQKKEQDAQKLSSMGIIADLINEGMNL